MEPGEIYNHAIQDKAVQLEFLRLHSPKHPRGNLKCWGSQNPQTNERDTDHTRSPDTQVFTEAQEIQVQG